MATQITKAIDIVEQALTEYSEITVKELAELTGLGKSTIGKQLVVLECDGSAVRRKTDKRSPETWSMVKTSKKQASEGGKPERLARGELRTLVLEYLKENPGESFTPTALGKVLRRSSGAVANALVRLSTDDDGDVTQVGESPRRYAFMGG